MNNDDPDRKQLVNHYANAGHVLECDTEFTTEQDRKSLFALVSQTVELLNKPGDYSRTMLLGLVCQAFAIGRMAGRNEH